MLILGEMQLKFDHLIKLSVHGRCEVTRCDMLLKDLNVKGTSDICKF